MEGKESRPLDAQLEQVTASLKASLDEACAADVQRLDTGESVRVGEVLAIASEAAKEVVSIRRKKRRQSEPPRTSGKTTTQTMGTHRQFVDHHGVQWDTFAVLPTTEASSLKRLPEPFRQGWLCFESAAEKRRLGPIPEHWETVSEDELRRLGDAARPVPNRAVPEQRDQPRAGDDDLSS